MQPGIHLILTTTLWIRYYYPHCGTPLQYSCLENPMDGGAWWAAVHGVTKSWAGLNDFTFTFHFPALEKAMATHSSVLAWRILGMGELRGVPSMGSHRVGHDWSDLAAAVSPLQVKKLKARKQLAWSHSDRKWWSLNLNWGQSVSKLFPVNQPHSLLSLIFMTCKW